MKKYNFYFCGKVISRREFEDAVPTNWEDMVEDFEFSWGYYKAILV